MLALADHLPPHPHRAPRRHFRGQARYYRQLADEAAQIPFDPFGWFDLWHYHADFSGYGNLSARHRRAHLAAHCVFFRRAADALAQRPDPFQLWLYLSAEDAGTDAVYLHTPNPNGTPFPIEPDDVVWDAAEMEALLEQEFQMSQVRAGRDRFGNFYIYEPGVGVPLDEAPER